MPSSTTRLGFCPLWYRRQTVEKLRLLGENNYYNESGRVKWHGWGGGGGGGEEHRRREQSMMYRSSVATYQRIAVALTVAVILA